MTSPAYLDDLTQIGTGRAQDSPSRVSTAGRERCTNAPPSPVRSHIDFRLTIPSWSDVASGQFLCCAIACSLQEARAEWMTQASRPKRAVQNNSKKVPEENLRIFFVFLLGQYNSLWLSSYRIFERDSWPKE